MKRIGIKKTIGLIIQWAVLTAIWLILFNRVEIFFILTGTAGSVAVLFLSRKLQKGIAVLPENISKLPVGVFFLTRLLIQIAISTTKTIVMSVTGNIKPKIVAVPVQVKSELGQLLLLNSITLTPTTIAVLKENNLVYIHHLQLTDKEDYDRLKKTVSNYYDSPLFQLLG